MAEKSKFIKDDRTKERIHQHLSDKNDIILDEDIANAITELLETSEERREVGTTEENVSVKTKQLRSHN